MKNKNSLIIVFTILLLISCKCNSDLFDFGKKSTNEDEETNTELTNTELTNSDESNTSKEKLFENPVEQLVEYCKNGDYENAAKHFINRDKCRNTPAPDQLHTCIANYENPDEKQPVERECNSIKGYAMRDYKVSFQKTEDQKGLTFYLYDVEAEGSKFLWVFTKINDEYVLADIDTVSSSTKSETPATNTMNENRSNMNVSPSMNQNRSNMNVSP